MSSSFVNLNRLRREQAAAAALKEQQQQQQDAAAAFSTTTAATAAPGSEPAVATTLVSGPSPPTSPPATAPAPPVDPRGPALIRRHHTVAGSGRPQRALSATQRARVREEDEGGTVGAGSALVEQYYPQPGSLAPSSGGENEFEDNANGGNDGHSVSQTAVSATAAYGLGLGRVGMGGSDESTGAKLTRHGSLPSRSTHYPISPVHAGFGPRSPFSSSYSTFSAASEDDHSTRKLDDDDDEWERALAEGRRTGGGGGATDESGCGSEVLLSSTFPRNGAQLAHQRSLNHVPSGSRSPTIVSGSSSGFEGSSSPTTSSSHHYSAHAHGVGGGHHARSQSHTESYSAATVRRHQSLDQRRLDRGGGRGNGVGIHVPARTVADDDTSSSGLAPRHAGELPPPTSPVERSPWNALASDLLSRQRSWDETQDHQRGPLSPIPGQNSRSRQASGWSVASDSEPVMSGEQLQSAFDALSLSRSTSGSLAPPGAGSSAAVSGGSGAYRGTPSPDSFSHAPPRTQHSRSPSLNPPPRFHTPSPNPAVRPASTGNSPSPIPLDSRPPPSFLARPVLGSGGGGGGPGQKLSLITDPTALSQQQPYQRRIQGPQSASAYVPPIGHTSLHNQLNNSHGGGYYGGPGGSNGLSYAGGGGQNQHPHHHQHQSHQPFAQTQPGGGGGGSNGYAGKPFTAVGTGWEQKQAILGYGPTSFGGGQHQPTMGGFSALGQQQPQNQSRTAGNGYGGQPYLPASLYTPVVSSGPSLIPGLSDHAVAAAVGAPGAAAPLLDAMGAVDPAAVAAAAATVVDVPSLIQLKGYNPTVFETNPSRARYFVIKSYTEDDVARSLKFEIWSSTTFGNKRLDRAFKESGRDMPIYLFFSVNSSGHFAGMAQMLTDVDYNTTSTVWAQDKWKGIFRVKWIYVRDIPNQALRHIRLKNTQELKPVTNSRDTQELLPDAGLEMLRIFHTYQSRTSLLQDYAFYDLQAMQKDLQTQTEAARQPIAHLPPFPSQPTYPSAATKTMMTGTATGVPGATSPVVATSATPYASSGVYNNVGQAATAGGRY